MQSEVVYSLNHDTTASIVFNRTLIFPKIYLHLHSKNYKQKPLKAQIIIIINEHCGV